jgi:hypothetical protein
MASWKKVIVSGSAAHLASVTASNIPANDIVVASTGGALSGSGLTLTGGTLGLGATNITSTGNASSLSGSFSGSFTGTASTASYVTGSIFTGTNSAASASYAATASYLIGGVATPNTLSNVIGGGITNFSFDGSQPVSIAVSGAAQLTNNKVVKWDDTDGKFVDSTITDSGTLVTFSENVTIQKDLIVQGTASFQETTNTTIADRFILLASGSGGATDGGIVVNSSATNGIGEVFGWDTNTSRWAVTSSFNATDSSFVPDAFMAAAIVAANATPSPAARYNKEGNIYVSTGDESIWIYS